MQYTIEDVSVFYDGVDHAECVAVHPDGSVWAGGEAGQIYRISPDGKKLKEVNNTGGFILGLAFSPEAEWLAICDLKNKCVWKMYTKSGSLEKFADGVAAHTFKIPNYPVFDSNGNLYISESGAFKKCEGKILKFNPIGEGDVWHNGPFLFANGMAFSPDEKYVYVVSSFLPGIERIAILDDGRAGDREVFATMPRTVPDGIAFDENGNLYVSCYTPNAIYSITPERQVTQLVEDWEAHTLSNPTNIAFGGENLDHLFTANLGRWHISKFNIQVKGLPLVSHKSIHS